MADTRSSRPRGFFSDDEQERILAAIETAERRTSGEIRLHLERDVPDEAPSGGDPYRRSRRVFERLHMHRTAARNGVLVYMAVRARRFAVVGDEALHARVGDDFWADVIETMGRHFAEERLLEGVVAGIRLIGEKLREHFPYRDDDVNELPDEISFD